ncbi:hypothetical protein J6X04_01580 [Candidatus Saccharibacteria bacterium]|nr:hypothetical protein [Candidatus Saccharibacteria bacterium]
MRNKEYGFEEADDERTWSDELIPDCEREDLQDESNIDLPVLEYVAEFLAMIDACGQVSYYFNMRKFVAANVTKAKNVAAAYQHDLRYYREQLGDWKAKAERSYGILGLKAEKLGYKMPEKRDILNALALHKDRRECYKYYLNNYLEKNKTFSPEELEQKYALRLKKRMKAKK